VSVRASCLVAAVDAADGDDDDGRLENIALNAGVSPRKKL
jgi:hypothetical protein